MQIFIVVCGLPPFSLRKRGNKATAASSMTKKQNEKKIVIQMYHGSSPNRHSRKQTVQYTNQIK